MLAPEKDVPDRDLVLDARLAETAPQILAGKDRQGIGRFAAIMPSTCFGVHSEAPRRIAILLDRSGSMAGASIEQAKRAIEACLAVLSDADSFGLVAFDNLTESFETRVVPATLGNRDRARAFLSAINARGGTELAQGVKTAVQQLEGAGGDVFIFTDGQVSGTEAVLAQARTTGTRLHCLGIGSASEDRFLSLLARETGGVSRFVTPRERVDMAALDLFASVGRPIATGLKADGKVQPEPPGTVFSGTPVMLFGEAAADTNLNVSWDGGNTLSLPVSFNGTGIGDTLWLLQGSRLITDWEIRYPAEEALGALEKRKTNRVAMRLRHLSETYGLASREMSLVAVVRREDDRPGELPHTRVVPVGMPQDTMFDSYFGPALDFSSEALAQVRVGSAVPPTPSRPPASLFRKLFRVRNNAGPSVPSAEDELMYLAARIESDGGMPGANIETRVAASIAALFAFLQHGDTVSGGAFRAHLARILTFLESVSGLSADRQKLVAEAIMRAQKADVPPGNWLELANKRGWDAIERALTRPVR
jgi:hypothetical protein